jgi:surface protein
MDVVTMVPIETRKSVSLDVVILINSFLIEKLTDENLREAIELWFEKKQEFMFHNASQFNGDLSQWDVRNVRNIRGMFFQAQLFGNVSQWI